MSSGALVELCEKGQATKTRVKAEGIKGGIQEIKIKQLLKNLYAVLFSGLTCSQNVSSQQEASICTKHVFACTFL
jgi:hypothetical protein